MPVGSVGCPTKLTSEGPISHSCAIFFGKYPTTKEKLQNMMHPCAHAAQLFPCGQYNNTLTEVVSFPCNENRTGLQLQITENVRCLDHKFITFKQMMEKKEKLAKTIKNTLRSSRHGNSFGKWATFKCEKKEKRMFKPTPGTSLFMVLFRDFDFMFRDMYSQVSCKNGVLY